jgi:hypothetical protein
MWRSTDREQVELQGHWGGRARHGRQVQLQGDALSPVPIVEPA